MSKRQKNILLCVGALLLGAVLYILFRRNTWVSQRFDSIPLVLHLRTMVRTLSADWARYYFPDLLWAFSLSCGIQAIYVPGRKGALVSGAVAFSCGVVWEVLQWSGVVSGTEDFWDVLMYFLGSILSILDSIKGEKRT